MFVMWILVGIILLFVARLFYLKREVRHVTEQLRMYNEKESNTKVDVSLVDRDMEELAYEINRFIDRHMFENREKIRFQTEMRQLIANMSHDLRTPLTSILGYMQLMEREIIDPKQKEYVSIARKRAKRLEQLLNEFFELSMMESSDYEMQMETVNLRNITVDVLMNFYDRFQSKGMEPDLQMTDKDLWIKADPAALTRIIENLLSNSLKYASGEIIIRLEEKADVTQLIVTNDAPHLNASDVQHFFDRFYTADKSRTGQNTGLGLAIVKTLMEKMGGDIRAELEQGKLSVVCEWKRDVG